MSLDLPGDFEVLLAELVVAIAVGQEYAIEWLV